MLRRILPFLLLALGMLLGILALEICFRLLPVNRGLVRLEPSVEWPLSNYRPHVTYSYSRSWSLLNPQHGRSNNYGHLASFDYEPGGAAVAVIGDSYIEARMNRFNDTIQAQLGDMLGLQRKVYGLGANGLSIADYLVLSKQAATEFEPAAFVYVIVDNDLSEAVVRRKGWHHFASSSPSFPVYVPEREGKRSWMNDFLASSSLYRYLKGNLGVSFDFAAVYRSPANAAPAIAVAPARRAMEISAIKQFVAMLPEATGLPSSCHIFLLDTDRYAIYDQRKASTPIDAAALKTHFLDEAKSAGLTIIDLAPLFAADYASENKKFDYFPNDRHWNWRGHHIAALAAKQALQGSASSCLAARQSQAAAVQAKHNERDQ